MTDISETLALALQYHQTGCFSEAAHLYSQILEQEPDNERVINLLGILAIEDGSVEEAIYYFQQFLNLVKENVKKPTKSLFSLNKFNQIKKCRYGMMLYNINDIYIGKSLDVYGEFSENEVEIFKRFVQPGCTILDVGANIGTHTLFFSKAVGLEGAVLAFEPQRVVFQTLCANLALNSITNTYAYNMAVGEIQGFIKTRLVDYSKPNNFGGLAVGNFNIGEQVPVITIDSLELKNCHLLKVDVEGMELQVLKGAVNTINQFKPFLYVENDLYAKNSVDLIRYIDSLGYVMYWHGTLLYNPNNYFHNSDNVFGNFGSRNMLCVHQSLNLHFEDAEKVEVTVFQE